ncbi:MULTISPECIES: recombinase family protein, partial [unclassified Microcoleus]|uniref:recombinase family protein n=1 Tax=unclassified Microcoleus TaxID=2642155 RepID=UPI002FD22899
METVRTGNVGSVVVAHKDRLARFGFELIEWLCQLDGTKIVVLNQDNLSPEREMLEDVRHEVVRLVESIPQELRSLLLQE